MAGNVWTGLKSETIPAFGASDIGKLAIVKITSGDRTVNHVASTGDEPLGVTRDYATPSLANGAVAVKLRNNEVLVTAGASILSGQDVGFGGLASAVHPLSGNTYTYPTFAPVTRASGTAVWRVGVARSDSNGLNTFSLRIDPRELSGLA